MNNINKQVNDIYVIKVSAEMVSKITDKILPDIKDWRTRPIDPMYPFAIQRWATNWDTLSTFFKYPSEIRKIIYTTNIIESLNRQYRKVTKTKLVCPSDESLEKILYLATRNISKNGKEDMTIGT